MSEITFAEAIRMVHPDSNPNIMNPGDKVRTIMMYKKDPKKMFSCLSAWGLVNGSNQTGSPKKQKTLIEGIDSLIPNHVYNGNVVIRHKSCYGYMEVLRTTSKRVYFTENTTKIHGMKYCHIKSVIKAFKKV